MRAILLTILACLLTSCISATREREAYCLAATMTDAWQSEHDLNSTEQAWRMAQQARFARSPAHHESSTLSVWFTNRYGSPGIVEQVASRGEDAATLTPQEGEEERTLYQRMVAARVRYGEAAKWYRLVTRRVQTRIEEDEMLYPVLGMLSTSTAIVLYPLVRWNVRSVLWDGIDPDDDNDPVQRFCASRLGQEHNRQP
jgi:hypothetical protein